MKVYKHSIQYYHITDNVSTISSFEHLLLELTFVCSPLYIERWTRCLDAETPKDNNKGQSAKGICPRVREVLTLMTS